MTSVVVVYVDFSDRMIGEQRQCKPLSHLAPNRYNLLYPSSPSTLSRQSPCLLRAAGVPRRMSFILWNVAIVRWFLILVNTGIL